MASKRAIPFHFPLGGISRRLAHRNQAPYTSPDAANVWPTEPLEERARGGSRPGMVRAYPTDLGTDIRMLNEVTAVSATSFGYALDEFNGTSLGSEWTTASWVTNPPGIWDGNGYASEVDDVAAVRDAVTIDTSEAYSVELYIVPFEGAHHGVYKIFARMDDTTPDATADGIRVELTMTGTDGSYDGVLVSVVGGVDTEYAFTPGSIGYPAAGIMRAHIDGDDVTVFWNGRQVVTQTVATHTGTRVGFGMDCTVDGGACLIDSFTLRYAATGASSALRTYLIASADGDLYVDDGLGGLTQVAGATPADRRLWATERLQKLYVADDGGVMVYDPILDTYTAQLASTGVIPTDCEIAVTYRDRLVLGKSAGSPHLWYMSRQGAMDDWDFSLDDTGSAVSGQTSEAGQLASPVTALIPYRDDYLIIGCSDSIWLMRGDPTYDARVSSLSYTVGILDQGAWCRGPNGGLFFLSKDGIYYLTPSAQAAPERLSREKMPQELFHINPDNVEISMSYDVTSRGIHLYLTSKISVDPATHWWFDMSSNGFWKVDMASDREPTCILQTTESYQNGATLIGCTDGYIRMFDYRAENDDGDPFDSYVDYGPIRMGRDELSTGILTELNGGLANNSGPVDWALRVAPMNEEAKNTRIFPGGTGTWETSTRGLQSTNRPRARGASLIMRLSNGAQNRAWAVEKVTAVLKTAGKIRLGS